MRLILILLVIYYVINPIKWETRKIDEKRLLLVVSNTQIKYLLIIVFLRISRHFNLS